ncbi:hypothetical protein [Mucilaginibacter sp.]|uniref:condensin complex protein MksE n=1 Tax=Mucilaginibacter sp. TaxID=1882438 RepID=UPI00262B4AFB|nr:hypothetical protein [Mucilaginibacter sp.]MDB4922903.1 uncharacterized protein [Mucilaginibacter sp.]
MENEDQQKELSPYAFLQDKQARKVFAKLDYALKSGMHIQRNYPSPEALYRFLENHFEGLCAYYADLFDVLLVRSDESLDNYYYIDFAEGSRGNLPAYNRDYLKTEHILVGILLFKVYKLDANIELDRITDFIQLLYQEYDELVHKIQWLLNKILPDANSDFSEDRFSDMVHKAFAEFESLGWVSREEEDRDRFSYQPSFERLRRMYYPQIQAIDELLKKDQA